MMKRRAEVGVSRQSLLLPCLLAPAMTISIPIERVIAVERKGERSNRCNLESSFGVTR